MNPYILLIEKFTKYAPDCTLKVGMGKEMAYAEIKRCFEIIEQLIEKEEK